MNTEKILSLQGKLKDLSPAEFKNFLQDNLSDLRKLENLYTYAHLRHDEDMSHDENKANLKKIQTLYHEYMEKTSWIEPEIISLSKEKINELLESKELEPYKFYLEKIVREKDHTLSPELEKLLAMASEPLSATQKVFTSLTDVDFQFGEVEDSKGKKHPLTHATYYSYIRSHDRVLRRNAFQKYHEKYKEFENTLTETLNGAVQTHYLNAKARNYKNCLQASLFSKNVDEAVYHNLIKTVRDNITALHKYVRLRKKLLGYDELHLYDMYVPLINVKTDKRSYKEAEDIVIESVAPLGKEYQELLRDGLKTHRWVDRFENKGKRSGAYSSGW